MSRTIFSCPFFVALLAFAAGSTAGAAEAPRWHVFQHEHVLGTSLELKFAAATAAQAEAAEAAALAEIDRLAKILSGYDATSEFRQWAATRGEPWQVSPELFEVLALFDVWRERTGGALDASAEVASQLWKSAAQSQRTPTKAELAAAIAAVHQAHWCLDPVARTATHLSDAPLILNSFAKSYIIERACTKALAAGRLETAIVNIGGDLVVRGASPETVLVADPVADAENDAPLTQLAVRDRAVATSGGYRRGVEIAGQWYSHLVDPRTAQPVDHVRSATVVAPRATDAGALATALCVMNPDDGLKLVATVDGAECFLVLSDGRRLASAGWTALETTPPPPVPSGVFAAVAPITPASGATADAWDPAFELIVNFEIASQGGFRAKRPFVAVWIADKDGFPLRTIALWYHGDRWLPNMTGWIRADQKRHSAEGGSVTASVSSATRSPGKYTLKWDGKDAHGQLVPRGKYTVAIEVAREHGTHQLSRQELDFSGQPQHVDLRSNAELASLSLDYRRKAAAP